MENTSEIKTLGNNINDFLFDVAEAVEEKKISQEIIEQMEDYEIALRELREDISKMKEIREKIS